MCRVLLIALTVLGIGTGLLTDCLLAGIVGAIPGWAVAGLVTATGLAVASALREHHSANQHYQLTGELEAIDLIVEKIETEEMLLDLLDLNIDFGQSYLFDEPRPSASSS